MSTDFHIFHGPSRGATAFQIACVAFAAIAVSQVIDAYVMHDLLRGSGFPAARLVAAATLGGALVSVPALRRTCRELLDAPPPKGSGLELAAIALLLVALSFPALVMQRWAPPISLEPAARGEVAAAILVCAIEDVVLLGLLYPAWALQWGWTGSLVATSAVAAIARSDMLVHFMTMLLLIALLRRTGSLLACVAVHSVAGVSISGALLGRFLLPADRASGEIEPWGLHLACLIVAGIGTVVYLRMARRDAKDCAGSDGAFLQR
ncbi:MAG: hypothetical protein ACXWF0_05595 [Usitatibacter sp.]